MSSKEAFKHIARILQDNFSKQVRLSTEESRAADDAGPVVLILGSGASAISHFPDWHKGLKLKILKDLHCLFGDDFIDDAWHQLSSWIGPRPRSLSKAELQKRFLKDASLEMICGVACKHPYADRQLRNIIADSFSAQGNWEGAGPPPLVGYELIAHMVKHGFVDDIITFNFDEVLDNALENELGPDGFVRIYSGYEPTAIHDTTKPRLLKIHGTVSSPESMRFTFMDVAYLQKQMRSHLELLLRFRDNGNLQGDSKEVPPKVHMISLGYSWQDPNLALWIVGNRDRIGSFTVVKRSEDLPEIFNQRPIPLRLISTSAMCPGGKMSIDELLWALTDMIQSKLQDSEPIQPTARHLILGNLFSDMDAYRAESNGYLLSRVRAEVLLHVAKSKGLVHTASAPDSPRIQKYFSRLRLRSSGGVTPTDFLQTLELTPYLGRVNDAEAHGTYYVDSSSIEEFASSLARHLIHDDSSKAEKSLSVPVYRNGMIVKDVVTLRSFLQEKFREILESPDIEVSGNFDCRVNWIYSRPESLPSYAAFGSRLRQLLKPPWTHLLAVVESERFMDVPWLASALVSWASAQSAASGPRPKMMLILPAANGLEELRNWQAFVSRPGGSTSPFEILSDEVPWWRHNRHFFLTIDTRKAENPLIEGIAFLRRCRSTVVSPVWVDSTRDCCRLLCNFLRYAREGENKAGCGFAAELDLLAPLIEESGALQDSQAARSLNAIQSAFSRYRESSPALATESREVRRTA